MANRKGWRVDHHAVLGVGNEQPAFGIERQSGGLVQEVLTAALGCNHRVSALAGTDIHRKGIRREILRPQNQIRGRLIGSPGTKRADGKPKNAIVDGICNPQISQSIERQAGLINADVEKRQRLFARGGIPFVRTAAVKVFLADNQIHLQQLSRLG